MLKTFFPNCLEVINFIVCLPIHCFKVCLKYMIVEMFLLMLVEVVFLIQKPRNRNVKILIHIGMNLKMDFKIVMMLNN